MLYCLIVSTEPLLIIISTTTILIIISRNYSMFDRTGKQIRDDKDAIENK